MEDRCSETTTMPSSLGHMEEDQPSHRVEELSDEDAGATAEHVDEERVRVV